MTKYQTSFKFKNRFPSRTWLHLMKIFPPQGHCLFRTHPNLAPRSTDVWYPGTHNSWTPKHDERSLVIIYYFYILFLFIYPDRWRSTQIYLFLLWSLANTSYTTADDRCPITTAKVSFRFIEFRDVVDTSK